MLLDLADDNLAFVVYLHKDSPVVSVITLALADASAPRVTSGFQYRRSQLLFQLSFHCRLCVYKSHIN